MASTKACLFLLSRVWSINGACGHKDRILVKEIHNNIIERSRTVALNCFDRAGLQPLQTQSKIKPITNWVGGSKASGAEMIPV